MSEFRFQPPARRLVHFTPLRYPGGKAKLAAYVKKLIKDNKFLDGEYVEPYAGGAAIAMELLFHEYISHAYINDVSLPIYTFWNAVLRHPEELCKRLIDTPVSVENWNKQKEILANAKENSEIDLGFATLFLNRTNRSGILNGGIIGGKNQDGLWKIDARFNKEELAFRIQSIAKIAHRVSLTRLDAVKFLTRNMKNWGPKSLVYLDPPYYKKGRDLYYDFYRHEDHAAVANFVLGDMRNMNWIVSYDNAPEIRALYGGQRRGTYKIGYSARSTSEGSEVMFFSDSLSISPLVGPVKSDGGFGDRETRSDANRRANHATA